MRVLLDHCVHKGFATFLIGHEVEHTSQKGWGNLSNGVLLRTAAEEGFDCIVTVDKGMRHQHNVAKLGLAIITIQSPDVSLIALRDYIPEVLDALDRVRPGISISIAKAGD